MLYNVLVSIHDLATFTESDFVVVAENLTTTNYTYEGLFSNSTYTFSIQPLNFLGFGARSIASKTVQVFDVPAAPASVSLSDFIRLINTNGNSSCMTFFSYFINSILGDIVAAEVDWAKVSGYQVDYYQVFILMCWLLRQVAQTLIRLRHHTTEVHGPLPRLKQLAVMLHSQD